ncbi:hypothetical protein VTN96DRAFT_7249 [Rasamsonia emersonii]
MPPAYAMTWTMEFNNIQPSEITFKQKLFSSQFSVIFLVDVRGKTCVMKVDHDNGPVKPAPPERETNIYICEPTAYRRLKKHGLCDCGIVPQFYGTMERLDLRLFQPHLKMLLDDKYPPNAVFLECIPNMEMLLPQNYTRKRMENLVHGIREIHRALVLHCDAKPRNMMVVRDDPERVVWLDFDRAQTYHADKLTERQRRFLEDY